MSKIVLDNCSGRSLGEIAFKVNFLGGKVNGLVGVDCFGR